MKGKYNMSHKEYALPVKVIIRLILLLNQNQ